MHTLTRLHIPASGALQPLRQRAFPELVSDPHIGQTGYDEEVALQSRRGTHSNSTNVF